MSPPTAKPARQRPKYYDLNLANLPAPGLLSIFHRISGAAMFLLLIPLLLFILQQSLQSEADFQRWKGYFAHPIAKLILLGFIWSYLHHFLAGIRYLLLDVHWGIQKSSAQSSAKLVLALGIIGTLLIGVWIW
ncbi:MAG: succinate dehydrogenase, cytochrome b556 subunit [Burkholderiales bacterium]|nr:succinate dehydrogenase, cytochrome b556 subunit [Burkholderiales bacterium]